MISEKQFSAGFAGFWAGMMPLLTPQLIAEFNLTGSVLTTGRRDWVRPLVSPPSGTGNDLVAELAFGLFAESIKEAVPVSVLVTRKAQYKKIVTSAVRRIGELRRRSGRVTAAVEDGTDEAVILAKRLVQYFRTAHTDGQIVVQPRFRGCGMLDSCYGDVLAGKCIYELKTVDRNLRSVDLRQAIIYCALNYSSQQFAIEQITILNPRRGIEYNFCVGDLIDRISGKTPAEFFHQMIDFVCGFEAMHQPS